MDMEAIPKFLLMIDGEAIVSFFLVMLIPTLYVLVRSPWFKKYNVDYDDINDVAEFNKTALLEPTKINLSVANIELLKGIEPSEKDYLINKAIAEGIFVDEDEDEIDPDYKLSLDSLVYPSNIYYSDDS